MGEFSINVVLLRKDGRSGVLQLKNGVLVPKLYVFFPQGQAERESIHFVLHPNDKDPIIGFGPAEPYSVFYLLPFSVDGKPLYQERD